MKRNNYRPPSHSASWLLCLTYSGLLFGQSLSPTTPSKEYIHLNGSTVAIEMNTQVVAGPTPTPRAGFKYARTLAILPPTPALTSDLTAFPVLFANTLTDLASTSSQGQVTSPQGFDIVFTKDAAGTQLLNWEMENYDPSTGSVVCWIQVPALSHTSTTYIYMSYGNSGIISAQSTASAVWDGNYTGVYHFSSGTGSTLSLLDSTSNKNNGSPNGSVVLAPVARVGGAVQFRNTNISIPMNGFPSGTSPTTLEGWFTLQSLPPNAPQDSYLVSYGQPVHGQANGLFFEESGTGPFDTGWDSHATSAADVNWLPSNTLLGFNQWHHVATTYVCGPNCLTPSGTVNVYVDGRLDATRGPNSTGATDQNTTNKIATLGAWMCSTDNGTLYPCFSMTGSADEIRISKTNRSSDWIQAEYQNQSNPAGFVAVGLAVAAH
ncbi:MAG: DUF2341 domain-containing protein [Acidobacteriota bacterium]|nr:DUF2341 domain-containing protein [Acidobacteriota bacterium]